jgi:hypothetical protein
MPWAWLHACPAREQCCIFTSAAAAASIPPPHGHAWMMADASPHHPPWLVQRLVGGSIDSLPKKGLAVPLLEMRGERSRRAAAAIGRLPH